MEHEEPYSLSDIGRWVHNLGVDVSLSVARATEKLFDLERQISEHCRKTAEEFTRLQDKLKE